MSTSCNEFVASKECYTNIVKYFIKCIVKDIWKLWLRLWAKAIFSTLFFFLIFFSFSGGSCCETCSELVQLPALNCNKFFGQMTARAVKSIHNFDKTNTEVYFFNNTCLFRTFNNSQNVFFFFHLCERKYLCTRLNFVKMSTTF